VNSVTKSLAAAAGGGAVDGVARDIGHGKGAAAAMRS